MIDQRRIAAICEGMIGSIPTVRVSSGPVGVTVCLGDEPAITVCPVGGQLLISTRTWLRARPPQSDSLLHHASAREEDWQICATGRERGLREVLHRAEPGLRYRATLPERIAAKLGGVQQRLLERNDPEYWTALARWIEGSGLLKRTDAHYALIYARKLYKGEQISERFEGWAARMASDAALAGFTALVTMGQLAQSFTPEDGHPTDEVLPDVNDSVNDSIEVAAGIQSIIDFVSRLDDLDIIRIAAAARIEGDSGWEPRAAVVRVNRPDERRRAKAAVARAFDELRERQGTSPDLDLVQRVAADAAAALALRDEIEPEVLTASLCPWERVTGQRLA